MRHGGGVDVVGLEGVSRVGKIRLALAALVVEAVVLAWLVGVALWDWWGAVLVGRSAGRAAVVGGGPAGRRSLEIRPGYRGLSAGGDDGADPGRRHAGLQRG